MCRTLAGLSFLALSTATAGTTPSTVALQSSANPANLGQAVTITAALNPPAGTGTVTFYDGVSVLGIRTLSGGQAILTTSLIPSGVHSLKAFYSGDTVYQVSASMALSQTVAALAQNGFQPPVTFGGLSLPRTVAVGDFNGDGKADFAIVDSDIDKLSIMLGNGDGTFRTAVSYGVGTGRAPNGMVVGDFNGDGRADLAIANAATAFSTVSVLLGNGDGTFQPAVNYSAGIGCQSIAAADFNGDGFVDLAVANFQTNNISVLLGNGNGTFRAAVNHAVGVGPLQLIAADFNGDGKADLAVSNFTDRTVSILLGAGNGTFQAPVNFTVGMNSTMLATADLNGDNRPDLIVANHGNNKIVVLLGSGDGLFKPAVNYDVAGNLQAVVVGDFNGDGWPDLVASSNAPADGAGGLNVLLGSGDGTFKPPVVYRAGQQTTDLAVGDFNGDGRTDVAVVNFLQAGTVSVLLGTPVYSDLTLTKSHTGDFTPGQTGAAYTIVASNLGPGPAAGAVTVVDTLPVGLTATAIAGAGWNCAPANLTCTRSDALASGGAYPPIILTVNVAADAPASVTNTATVSGGGESNLANDTAADTANVTAGLAILTTSLDPGSPGVAYDQILVASGGSPPYSWSLVSGGLPDGIALSDSGEISGTPTTAGASTFVAGVADATGSSASQTMILTIADAAGTGKANLKRRGVR